MSAWLLGHWHHVAVVALICTGLYIVIARDNLVKKMMGLNIFQVGVILFSVSMGRWPAAPRRSFPRAWSTPQTSCTATRFPTC